MRQKMDCSEHMLKFTILDGNHSQSYVESFCHNRCHDEAFRCIPMANPLKDVCYPMFLQQSQIRQISQSHERYEEQFKLWRRKALESQDLHRKPTNEIYQPVKKGYFCQNCQAHFIDYAEHIKNQNHMNNIRQDPWYDRLKKTIQIEKLEIERSTLSKQKKKHEDNKEHRGRMKRAVEKFRGLINILGSDKHK